MKRVLQSEEGFTVFEIIVVMILLAIFGLVAYLAHQAYLSSTAVKVSVTPTPTHKLSTPCDISENARGCVNNKFQVVAPNGGEEICLGSTFDVKWTAPDDMDVTRVELRQEGGSYSKTLGVFPASDKSYSWKVDDVVPSRVYKIWINSNYKGYSVNESSDKIFTIKDCGTAAQ